MERHLKDHVGVVNYAMWFTFTRQMLKASRGEPDKYKLRYIGVKAACV